MNLRDIEIGTKYVIKRIHNFKDGDIVTAVEVFPDGDVLVEREGIKSYIDTQHLQEITLKDRFTPVVKEFSYRDTIIEMLIEEYHFNEQYIKALTDKELFEELFNEYIHKAFKKEPEFE